MGTRKVWGVFFTLVTVILFAKVTPFSLGPLIPRMRWENYKIHEVHWIGTRTKFLSHDFENPRRSSSLTLKDANRWEREIDENSRQRAASKGRAGETLAGAVLGGLLLGPFGALFGASIGSSLGRQNAENEARRREMERLGLSPDMLDAAREIGAALQRSMEGLKAVQENYETQKRLALRLEMDAEELHSKARDALKLSDDNRARNFLFQRENVLNRLKDVLKACATAREQVGRMEENARLLEQRAMEMDSLLRRTVGAKAIQDSAQWDLSLSSSDPLLDKFRDMGID